MVVVGFVVVVVVGVVVVVVVVVVGFVVVVVVVVVGFVVVVVYGLSVSGRARREALTVVVAVVLQAVGISMHEHIVDTTLLPEP